MSEATSTEMVPAPANGVAAVPPPPQFARGFDGMATEPFPEAARKVLAAPVEPHDVEIKPDGIVFLPGVAYRRILTRAFGAGGWALAPRSPARVMGNIVVYHGALYCLGRFVAEAVGECAYRENSNMSYASCVEGAKTDALSRCCKDLGIATEMWDANWREEWKAKYAWRDEQDRTRDGKPKWKLKARVSNPHDLMAGAGGVAPEPPPPKAATSAPAAVSAAATAEGTATVTSASPSTASSEKPAPAFDDGTAGTEADYNNIANMFKRLAWKRGYVKIWLKDFFGVESHTALTAQQAASACAMLVGMEVGKEPRECPAYVQVVKKLRAEGKIS